MQITNIYTIYGAEPFLIELKRDEIIKDLKNKGFLIREIFFNNDSSFKLENLLRENESSLFSEKKILDLRLNSSITKENTEKFLVENNLKMKDLGPILRSILTGKTNTPDIFKVIFIIGRNECIKRLTKV